MNVKAKVLRQLMKATEPLLFTELVPNHKTRAAVYGSVEELRSEGLIDYIVGVGYVATPERKTS